MTRSEWKLYHREKRGFPNLTKAPKYCLWDTVRYVKKTKKLIWKKSGLFDYDKNIFMIPKKMFYSIKPSDKHIIQYVGYRFR